MALSVCSFALTFFIAAERYFSASSSEQSTIRTVYRRRVLQVLRGRLYTPNPRAPLDLWGKIWICVCVRIWAKSHIKQECWKLQSVVLSSRFIVGTAWSDIVLLCKRFDTFRVATEIEIDSMRFFVSVFIVHVRVQQTAPATAMAVKSSLFTKCVFKSCEIRFCTTSPLPCELFEDWNREDSFECLSQVSDWLWKNAWY